MAPLLGATPVALAAYSPSAPGASDLADSWDISAHGKTYTFHLQPGVKWHDDVDFTSDDVKFSMEQVLLKYHARTRSSPVARAHRAKAYVVFPGAALALTVLGSNLFADGLQAALDPRQTRF